MKNKNTLLKITAAVSMALVPMPVMLFFETIGFGSINLLRYIVYFALSFIPISLGYFAIRVKRTRTTPKGIFLSNMLIGGICLALASALGFGISLAENIIGGFKGFYLFLALAPGFFVWFVLGTRLYKKPFTEVFTPVWLGAYIVETFLFYIFASVTKVDHPYVQYAAKAMVYLLIILALLTVLLVNQTNIDTQINRRKNIGLILPKGIKLYNAKLILIIGGVFLLGLILKDTMTDILTFIVINTIRIIVWIMGHIGFADSDSITGDGDEVIPGQIDPNTAPDILIYLLIVAAVVLVIVFRKQIIGLFKKIAARFFKKLSTDVNKEHEDYYTEYYEAIDLDTHKVKKKTSADCLKQYKKETDINKKYRLGYRLYLMWLAKRNHSINECSTLSEQKRAGDVLYHGEEDLSAITNAYGDLRYGDNPPDNSYISSVDRLVKELYK